MEEILEKVNYIEDKKVVSLIQQGLGEYPTKVLN